MAARAGSVLPLGAWAAADLADTDPAIDRAGLAQRLQDWADAAECFGANPGRVLATAYGTTFDAELARLRRTDEEVAWRAAKDTWTSHEVPHHAAYAGWRLAECLIDVGQRRSAEDELSAAYETGQGHFPLRAAIEGFARRGRLALATDAEGDSHPSGDAGGLAPHGLTARELDVLRLLGTGATNAEIGRRLYISPKTVSVHVSAIIRKLGVTGRVQAATVAERMGLLGGEDRMPSSPGAR
jgi:DNA-binding CsgD family transcriptional regulator